MDTSTLTDKQRLARLEQRLLLMEKLLLLITGEATRGLGQRAVEFGLLADALKASHE